MSRGYFSAASVGNDFVMAAPRFKPILSPKVIEVQEPIVETRLHDVPITYKRPAIKTSIWSKFETKYKVVSIALISLIVLAVSVQLISPYWYEHVFSKISISTASTAKPIIKKAAPLNPLVLSIPTKQLTTKLQTITAQPAKLVVGSQTVTVSASTISSWITVSASKNKKISYLKVDPSAVSASLVNLANQNITAPVDSVSTDEDGVNTVIFPGSSGTALADQAALSTQGYSVANSLLSAKGFNLNVPTVTAPAVAGSLTTMGKVLDVNVTTKRMYAYDNGQLVNTFLITAGAPDTPTPIGEFHIWEKLPVQTMSGYNPNGTKYVQPNVQWVNYFDHSGDAVHGNYWRPASYFGNVNSSHGCVGVQDAQAEWIYDWAPIGTTVITHT